MVPEDRFFGILVFFSGDDIVLELDYPGGYTTL